MALAAEQVVQVVAARVSGAAAALGLGFGGVRTSRAWPWAEAELPACRVFAVDEAVQPATVELWNEHTLALDVQFTLRAVAELDTAMNAAASAALQALFVDAPAVPYAMQLTGIAREVATEGEAAVGRLTLQLQCRYFAAPNDPETIVSS